MAICLCSMFFPYHRNILNIYIATIAVVYLLPIRIGDGYLTTLFFFIPIGYFFLDFSRIFAYIVLPCPHIFVDLLLSLIRESIILSVTYSVIHSVSYQRNGF